MTTYSREDGCIVTAITPDGREIVRHRQGGTYEALREITDRLPEGSTVEAISTPRTILRDLKFPHRKRSMRRRRSPVSDPYASPNDETDPWSVERTLLAMIDRLDLLPARARTPHKPRHSRRNGGR